MPTGLLRTGKHAGALQQLAHLLHEVQAARRAAGPAPQQRCDWVHQEADVWLRLADVYVAAGQVGPRSAQQAMPRPASHTGSICGCSSERCTCWCLRSQGLCLHTASQTDMAVPGQVPAARECAQAAQALDGLYVESLVMQGKLQLVTAQQWAAMDLSVTPWQAEGQQAKGHVQPGLVLFCHVGLHCSEVIVTMGMLQEGGAPAAAVLTAQLATSQAPQHAGAALLLAAACLARGQPGDASLAEVRTSEGGSTPCLQRRQPRCPDLQASSPLRIVLQGHARDALRTALHNPTAWHTLGLALQAQRQHAPAEKCLQAAGELCASAPVIPFGELPASLTGMAQTQ